MRTHDFAVAIATCVAVLLLTPSVFAQNDVDNIYVTPKVTATFETKPGPGMLTHYVQPVYPQQARGAALAGDVTLKYVISADGTVEQIERYGGDAVLAEAAMAALKQWKFKPYESGGKPVPKPESAWFRFEIRENPYYQQETSLPPESRKDPKLYLAWSSTMPELLVNRPLPVYPPEAVSRQVQGTVVLKATIGREGAVKNVSAISGPSELRQSAIDAVQKWRYRPYMDKGELVELPMKVTVNFTVDVKHGN